MLFNSEKAGITLR